jgi:hypothetical protein
MVKRRASLALAKYRPWQPYSTSVLAVFKRWQDLWKGRQKRQLDAICVTSVYCVYDWQPDVNRNDITAAVIVKTRPRELVTRSPE